MPDSTSANVAIVGGGITGLSAAWYLQKSGVPYTILEKRERFGGKIQTDHVDVGCGQSFIIERGADAFLSVQKPWATELSHELGLEDQVLHTEVVSPALYVLKEGKLIPMPKGLQLIIPTDRQAFLSSSLMTEEGKLRLLAEEILTVKEPREDESIAQFVRRRLGDEAVEMLAEPLLSGIYSMHPEEQSLLATFPRYRHLVEMHGSLIRGALQLQQARLNQKDETDSDRDQVRPHTAFISFREGTEVLPRELVKRLTGDMRLGTEVTAIRSSGGGLYLLTLSSGESLQAESVILTGPSALAARLVEPLSAKAAAQLRMLRVVSTGVIFLAYPRAEVQHPLNGFGAVIPRREQRSINAMTWMSSKFSHRAPQNYVLLRLFFGGARTPHMMEKSDEAVLAVARSELAALMDIEADPIFHRVYRWRNAQPLYDVGHLARIEAIEAALPEGIYVAGSPYRGVGIPDCVRQGRDAAQKISVKRG